MEADVEGDQLQNEAKRCGDRWAANSLYSNHMTRLYASPRSESLPRHNRIVLQARELVFSSLGINQSFEKVQRLPGSKVTTETLVPY